MKEKFEKPLDLNQWAYAHIKQMILDNAFQAGAQINIEELTARLGISRTPVREALIRLKQNGLVEAVPRVGFFVCGITKKEFRDIFELRRAIECYAAMRCAAIMTQEQIDLLETHHLEGKAMMQENRLAEFNEKDVAFHGLIVGALANGQIERVMGGCEDLICRQRAYALESAENVRLSVAEHEAILRAIAARDARGAEAAMNLHITDIEKRLTAFVHFQPAAQ